MVLVEPLHQRTAGVQRNSQIGIRFKDFQKGQVARTIGLLEDAFEVADRLVVMQYKAQTDQAHDSSQDSEA